MNIMKISKIFAALFVGVFLLQAGCAKGGGGGGSGTELPLIPVDENQAFEFGLKGEPKIATEQYRGDITLDFTYDGKTTTSAAGQLEVGFARSNDQLTITYSIFETGSTVPSLSNSYVVTIKGNLLVNAAGKESGKIGWLSLLLDDPQWTYKFFKGSDVDDGKKVIKVTAASKQGQTSVVYKGLLKLK